MRTAIRLTTLSLLLLLCAGATPQRVPSQVPSKPVAKSTTTQPTSDDGQQVFRRNCSRCHKAPEAIPPSISATVALHMRIRAGLSDKDYRRLLAFLNP